MHSRELALWSPRTHRKTATYGLKRCQVHVVNIKIDRYINVASTTSTRAWGDVDIVEIRIQSESAHSFEVKYLRPTLTKLFIEYLIWICYESPGLLYGRNLNSNGGSGRKSIPFHQNHGHVVTLQSHFPRCRCCGSSWLASRHYSLSLVLKFFLLVVPPLLLLVHLSVQSKVSQHRKHPSMLSIALGIHRQLLWASQVPESWYILFVRHSLS